MARVLLPLPEGGRQFRTYKLCKRFEQDISAVCAAFCLRINEGVVEEARVCYGGMAAIPKRASHCERALVNQTWNEANIENAMREMSSDFDPMGNTAMS